MASRNNCSLDSELFSHRERNVCVYIFCVSTDTVTPAPFCRVSRQTSRHHLHKKAVIIQKIWRGFTARACVRQMVKAAYFIMKMNFYEEMAVRIQRRWRGFFVRKYIHDFYARKKYLERLLINNELMRRELDEIQEVQRRERECLKMVKEQTARVYKAHRLHHLISTKQCPGVFNSPFRSAPHEMELLLREVKYQTPTWLPPRSKGCLWDMSDPAEPSFSGTLEPLWIKSTRACDLRPKLPPITRKKQQVKIVKARTITDVAEV
ncbi:spermatogenesis-associated protein 17 isoform X2 [Kryptolebias marmoratus]|uniref:spermatogenesis-associated protein 17 isoform X2 n=1 Tax=Kryptolebias marmoratus TaxID=37003 RepID=UPI000D530B86|nr:spermatogenesis-associated protein 17 isoform X2 [Kryptolebias marmoratus]